MTCGWCQADVWRIWREGQSLEGGEVRNTVIITIAFQLLFTAFNALQNLHSSLHDEEFLGLTCLAVIYATATVSSILAPAIIARVGAKAVLVMSFGAHCFYILANFYPSFASMAPVAVVLGFFNGPAWTCQSLYVTACAFSYSKRASSSPYNVLSRFNSLFFGVLATTQIAGNLITSTVIRDGVGNISETIVYEFCGANDCPANENATEIGDPATWVIDTTLGVLLGCALLGLVLVVVLLVPLPRSEVVQDVTLRDRLFVYFRVVMTTNMILLAPFMLFTSVQHAFIISVFTKAYVACPIGIHNVGFVMASYGATTPVFMAIFGQLARVTGRFILLVASLVTNLILLVFLFSWAPTADDEVIMYLVAIVWGLVESILLAQANALIAMLYPDDKEAAFANYHAWRSLGYTVSFANSTYLCVSTKLILCILLVCLALVLYVFVEVQAKVQEHRDLKKRDQTMGLEVTDDGDEQSSDWERRVSSGRLSIVSLQQFQERKSFDFMELSEIIKEAQGSWTRDQNNLTLDLPRVMSREHLQQSKATTLFHTLPALDGERVGGTGDMSPSVFAQSVLRPFPRISPKASPRVSPMPSPMVQRSKSDSNLKIAQYQQKKMHPVSSNGQIRAGRHRSEDNGKRSSEVLKSRQSRRHSNFEVTATKGKTLSDASQGLRRPSVFQKVKERIASRKRLSLQISDTNQLSPASPSPKIVIEMVSSPSSGYDSLGSRSPLAGVSGDSPSAVVHRLFPPTLHHHRHSVDTGALSRVTEDSASSGSDPAVTFHLGSVETIHSDSSNLSAKADEGRRKLSIRSEANPDSPTTKKNGISRVFSKMAKRHQRNSVPDGVTNTAFLKIEAHSGNVIDRAERADEEEEGENEYDASDVDSDGFFDDDEEECNDDSEFYEEPTLSKSNTEISLRKVRRNKRKKILSQTEDVSSIY